MREPQWGETLEETDRKSREMFEGFTDQQLAELIEGRSPTYYTHPSYNKMKKPALLFPGVDDSVKFLTPREWWDALSEDDKECWKALVRYEIERRGDNVVTFPGGGRP
jgi:hypothetical protein